MKGRHFTFHCHMQGRRNAGGHNAHRLVGTRENNWNWKRYPAGLNTDVIKLVGLKYLVEGGDHQ